jgi:hypothetical protein
LSDSAAQQWDAPAGLTNPNDAVDGTSGDEGKAAR